MSDELLNTITIWIFVPSMTVIVLVQLSLIIGPTRGHRRRRRVRQLERLEQVRAAHQGQDLEIDWIDYKEIPKSEILDVLGKHGWQFVDEQIGGQSWLLRFSLQPASRRMPDSRKRLHEELAAAKPDVEGRYHLDTNEYLDVPMAEIGRAIRSAGWNVEHLSPESPRSAAVITRPGTVTTSYSGGPFAGTSTPDELREDPVVAARAAEIEREKGFDPLSQVALNRARERHNHWAKKFGRQVRLASFYWLVGPILLLATLATQRPGKDEFLVMLVISLIPIVLGGIATFKAVRIRRARKAEIGDVLAAYTELDNLSRTRRASRT
ncbi:hypothetical protein [Amycolatopsis palatopharyngis]|uniref:hypothetical protein n=1 Tax=Amycolatopsis palatopharyngis TaxID=187982 RepID=UPI000E23F177|nr:hypothetical protein [Amycolatopsis palatopharyngis]